MIENSWTRQISKAGRRRGFDTAKDIPMLCRWFRSGWMCARDESGAIVVLFALLLVPIAGLMAGAIDFARQLEAKQELQDSLDSGALAAAKYIQANATADPAEMAAVEEKAKAVGTQMFRANFSSAVGLPAPEPVFAIVGDRVAASAEMQFEAAFLGILGMSQLGAAGHSEAFVPARMDAEIVMVLDYSGSMRDNDKYKRMAEAAKGFINRMKEEALANTLLGLVPFSDFVRLDLKGRFIRDVQLTYFDQTMSLCVSNRDYPFSTTDESPTAAVERSKWRGIGVPEGTLSFPGRLSSGLEETLYGGKSLEDLLQGCEAMANRRLFVRDLSDDYQMMLDAIDEMQTHEYTNIALGAEIGWHVLSSNELYTAGAPSSSNQAKKVLILLTDGMQTIPAQGPSGTSIAGANESLAEVCDGMAAADIHVFTIAYDLEDKFTRDLLASCASEASYFFEASVSADLSAVFDQIYDKIAEPVRLTQ